MDTNFFQSVYRLVERIPHGQVATYGQIAAMISTPRAARAVGWALRALPDDTNLPWQRVVSGTGRLTISHPLLGQAEQAKRLLAEGVQVTKNDDNYFVDLKVYLWKI